MPWSNQSGGGGPWGGGGGDGGGGGRGPWGGGGGQNPWGRGGGGGGGQPPDLEEVLRKGQERMKRLMPGGFGSGKGLLLVALVIVVAWFATGFYRVQPDEQGVVLVFGKAVDLTGPGLHYNFPAPIGDVIRPKVTVQRRVDVGYRATPDGSGSTRSIPEESLMLTGDENIVDMNFTVLWRIGNARDYLFNIRDPETTVKAAAESAMREVVGQSTFDSAVTLGRADIEAKSATLLQQIVDSYDSGITIERVNLQKSDPPTEVIDSFNDVQRARQERERLQNQAEAYANTVVPEARGFAEQDIRRAEAFREQQIQEAQGEADRFLSVYNAYQVAPVVTRQRMYLETMGKVLGQARKIIIDQSQGAQGVVPYLPLPEVQRRQEQGRGAAPGN